MVDDAICKKEKEDRETEEPGQRRRRRRGYRSRSKVEDDEAGGRELGREAWPAERISFIHDFRSYV